MVENQRFTEDWYGYVTSNEKLSGLLIGKDAPAAVAALTTTTQKPTKALSRVDDWKVFAAARWAGKSNRLLRHTGLLCALFFGGCFHCRRAHVGTLSRALRCISAKLTRFRLTLLV